MRILVVGGGPAGLYFSILMKKADPRHEVTIYERNPRGQTHGWGVVFSDETLDNLREADDETHDRIISSFAYWQAIDTYFRRQRIRSVGHGFSGIARRELLRILEERAEALGANIRHDRELTDFTCFRDYDLVIAADGVRSKVRDAFAGTFQPDLQDGLCRYIWLGTKKQLDAFTFIFERDEAGWFQVHAYRFDSSTSTFIVETDEPTFARAGFADMPVEDSIAYVQRLFAPWLDGHDLLANRSTWLNFVTVRNRTWHHDNVVLLGDAAHTAHFSIGSGTKLAMEDAIALADAFGAHSDVEAAVTAYEEDRRSMVIRTQRAAEVSRQWFENVPRHTRQEPLPFTFSLLTRSKRITYDNLKMRDPELVDQAARWFVRHSTPEPDRADREATPMPFLQPMRLRSMELANRVVVSPMCMYSAADGTVSDFHLVHLGSRAIGGAGLLFTEMTCVAPDARITPGCAGLYRPEHVAAWRRVVEFVHRHSQTRFCIQLGHAGRKGSTRLLWEGMDEPLADGNWPLIAPSPLPYSSRNQVPKEMDRADMDRVRDQFTAAARMADDAGFDMLELHMAHGYLLGSFLSPLTNRRGDDYGGSHERRLRYPLEVFDAVRAIWPESKPMSVRLSAVDWKEGGTTADDAVVYARALKEHGVDILDVSAGQTVPDQEPVYGRMFQTPFSDKIRNEVEIPTIAVGNITSADQINTILVAGRADLVALARPHLRDPYFTLHAAAEAEEYGVEWPLPYTTVQPQPPAAK